MVRTPPIPESGGTVCPACNAAIRMTSSARRRRVQCPKCREVVLLEGSPEKLPLEKAALTDEPAPEFNRMAQLEARVEALEATLRDAMAADRARRDGIGPKKLLWITTDPAHPADFSTEQGLVLFHNLAGVRTQAITIRTPAGDSAAREHAMWFKSIFERAGWIVRGPEEITPDVAVDGLSLAVPELPVAREAAATYFALKAAGFAPITVLDAALGGEPGREDMSLTLPPEKAA